MGSFNASLKTIGDTRGLPATVKLEEGRLSIIAGDAPIGDWPLGEIGLDPVPTGYRLAAEGEQLIIEMDDSETFAEELARSSKRKQRKGGLIGRKAKSSDEKDQAGPQVVHEPLPPPEPKRPERRGLPGASVLTDTEVPRPSKSTAGLVSRFRTSTPKTEAPAKPERARKPRRGKRAREERTGPDDERGSRLVGLLDRTIDATERRWGSLLPVWVFNRIVFVSALALFGVALVFRGVTSIVLLIAGVLALMLGGASYTDDVMASKLLPGRTTPTHVLIVGVSLIAFGILFGIVA